MPVIKKIKILKWVLYETTKRQLLPLCKSVNEKKKI